jgi:1-acyl-sn-glycerol-3-phosphate acyltransferase
MAMSRTRRRIVNNIVVRSVLSVWAWLVLGVVIVIWVPLMAAVLLCTAPFDKARYITGYLFRKLTVVHQVLNPLWTFRTGGIKVSDPRRPYVVVANHESFVDMLLISHLPWEMKWLAKEDFFKYPLIGWMMRMASDIRLVRGQRDSVVTAMEECRDRLRKKVSVMIFPEGTRTRDGNLQPFKSGAFRLAIETGTPILPLAVHGTYAALQKGDWRFGVTDAEVRVLEPIDTAGMTEADVGALRDRVQSLIAAEVQSMRATDPHRDGEAAA